MFGRDTRILLLVAPLLLASCAGLQLGQAEKVEPQGNAFQTTLYEGYMDLARSEYAQGDYRDSDVFAQRAMAAAAGTSVEPEALDARDLPADAEPDLADARERLTALIDRGALDHIPELIARAQVGFDCWMEQQEENFQPDHIAACRQDFFGALIPAEAYMQRLAEPERAEAEEPAPAPAPQPAEEPEPAEFIVFFETDSARLTPANAATVRRAAAEAERRDATTIRVVGHADRAGDASYNLSLSQGRAEAVRQVLIAEGIAAGRIRTDAVGETQPEQATQDGEPSVFNRRVTISF